MTWRTLGFSALLPVILGTGLAHADSALIRMTEQGDLLGARLRVRELATGKLDAKSWRWLDLQVTAHPEWGEDLGVLVIERAAEGKGWTEPHPAQPELAAADEAMLTRRFNEAAQGYRTAITGARAADLPPSVVAYARLALARALYAAKRFDEAYVEAKKIPPSFARYRHVLFLRMWAAFRAGRVELALGDIAAQRSDYFGPILEPESYLLLTYLLKRLCRDAEAMEVIAQVEGVLRDLKSGKTGYRDWARLEVGTRNFFEVLERADPEDVEPKKREARTRERAWIRQLLQASFEKKKKQWLDELPRVIAYSRLATTPGMGSALKPIEKITSREKVLSQGYEIWPSADGEQWLDELASHRYLGDSQCAQR